jgi:hypothetical protein
MRKSEVLAMSYPSNHGELPRLSRRDWLKMSSLGVVGYSLSGWMQALADDTAALPKRGKSCILLWMNGGPSQTDTFDLKPGHANGGPFKEVETSVEGIKISEHLPKIAKHMDHMAIIRSMSSKENDHGQGTYYLHTGYAARGAIQYPTIGSLISKEIGSDEAALPNFVSIAPFRAFNAEAYTSGFLGPKYAPLMVGEMNYNFGRADGNNYEQLLKVQDLAPPTDLAPQRFQARVDLLRDLQRDFVAGRPGVAPKSHMTAYERAVKLMRTAAQKAFNLDEEPGKIRDAYGRNIFGQGCLLARRLVEQGVPFIEVTLGSFAGNNFGWDTHQNNFEAVKQLSNILDPAWAALMDDLKERGLLESTLIVWMGEFGRTPQITKNSNGREHFPNAWSTVLAGGCIKGGQVIGKTSADGTKIDEREVKVPDFLATIAKALGIDPTTQNMSNVGRPIRIADPSARPISELLNEPGS